MPAPNPSPRRDPKSTKRPALTRRARLVHLKHGLPRQLIARRSGGDAPKNPIFARAGGSTIGGALPAGRATRGLTALVVGALFLLSGRWYFGQKLNLSGELERVVRAQLIPQLEKRLGAKVEVGAFETDWLGRVTMRDVVVGRDAQLPTGALAQVRGVTIGLDLPGLALRRVTIPEAIRSVALDGPQIYVRRDQSGINWQKILQRETQTAKIAWTGRVTAVDGRVYYLDTVQPSASGRPLIVDAQGIDASVDALANAPYRFAARAAKPYFGNEKLLLKEIVSGGTLGNDFKRALASVQTTALPLATLADFAFPKRDVVVRGGSADANVQLVLEDKKLAPHGALMLRGVAATFLRAKEPNSARPLEIDDLSGPLRFAGEAFSTSGASFRALDAVWNVAGAGSIANQTPIFDVDVATQALPIARLRAMMPAATRNFGFSSGAAKLNAHLAGTTSQIAATGVLQAPNARFSDAKTGVRATFPFLRTTFAAATSGDVTPKNGKFDLGKVNWRFAARFASPDGQLTAPQGQIGAKTFAGDARGAKNGGLEVHFEARDFALQSPRYGASRGDILQINASTPQISRPDWRGQARLNGASTSALRFAAFSPDLARAVGKSGQLNLAARFSGLDPSQLQAPNALEKLRAEATFSLSGLELNPAAFPSQSALPLGREDFTLSALRGRVGIADGRLTLSRASAISSLGAVRLDAAFPLRNPQAARVALSLPSVAVDAARFAPFLRAQNVALEGRWRGRVSLLSRQGQSGKFGLDFNLRAPASTLRGLGSRGARVNLISPTIVGRADFDAQNPARGWNAAATLRALESRAQSGTLGRFAALPATVSGARAVGLELNLVARDAGASAPLDWAGEMSAQRLSAPLPDSRRGLVFATISEARAHLEGARGGVKISRIAARFGDGRIEGSATIENGAPWAKILARNLDMKTVQQLLAPQTLVQARLSGSADLALQIAPNAPMRAQLRLARGALTVPQMAGAAPFPLNGARAVATMDKTGVIQISDAAIWSEGARFAGDATLGKTLWTGNFNLSGARLARFAALPFARQFAEKTRPDGLLNGSFAFEIDPRNPTRGSISGGAAIRLASIAGARIDAASGKISAQNGARGWKLALLGVEGEIEDAPFAGEVRADSLANAWSARLSTSKLGSGRLTRLGALNTATETQSRAEILARALPIAGEIGADVELSGTLRGANGKLAPRAGDGFVRVSSGPLAWRGRSFGALRADVEVVNGVARAKTLEFSRPATAGTAAAPIFSVAGDLPLDPNASGLNAQIRVASAPLSFFTAILDDGRDALARAGIEAPFFERAVNYVDKLPDGTTGDVALQATLQGAWRAPRLHVSSLTLRNGRTRVPSGGLSPPALFDAAFVYEKGAVTIEKAEFRLKKSVIAPLEGAEEEDDTLLRVEPGGSAVPDGPISLAADVFNANLSQLSTWVPALRNPEGGPLLRGELTEISFRVGGTTLDPSITGSVQAENLAFSTYTLDRLRISRFQIAGGAARVEAGNLTLVRGAFQSSAAYGSVAWKWAPPGPDPKGALDLHFPVQTRDFGALVGVAMPSLSVADAEEFRGSIDVTGTLQTPQISGAVTIRDGQFRFDPRQNALAAGVREVSGTVRFVGGNQLLIDADDPLKGKLVAAQAVVGRVARRDDAAGGAIVAAGGPDPKKKPKKAPQNPDAPKLGGDFVLRGSVTRPLQLAALDARDELTRAERRAERQRNPDALRRRVADASAQILAQFRYDLDFSLDNGAYSSAAFGGVENVSLGALWRTGAGENPETKQNLRWMLAARGKGAKKKNGGELASFGSLTLRSDFASGVEALGRSRANDFSGEADFAGLEVAKRVKVSSFPDRRAQVRFDHFAAALTGAGSGVVDGRLVLDNRARIQQPPREAVQLQRAALSGRVARPSMFGPEFEAQWLGTSSRATIEAPAPRAELVQAPDEGETIEGERLRLGGVLTLESARISGAPAGGEVGGTLLLSRLPDVPVLDVRLVLGREVEIVTSAFRAGLEGEIVASGSPRSPQILGVLQTRDGQVRFPNARARVVEGRVSLAINANPETDGLRTRIDIDTTARGQAGRYAITLRMRGPLDMSGAGTQNLNIEVTSNPPLSQSEAFEQLLGTVPTQERQSDGTFKSGSSNQAYARAVLNVLSAPLFSGLEQSVAKTLGLTSVSFEYRFNEPLAVEFTKAIGDRVFLSYRRSLGSGPTSGTLSNLSDGRTPFELRIEYRIKGDYLLGLQTDEQRIPKLTVQKTVRF